MLDGGPGAEGRSMATMFWLFICGLHIGATWRIRLNHLCAAAMRLFVKLLPLGTCYYYCVLMCLKKLGPTHSATVMILVVLNFFFVLRSLGIHLPVLLNYRF